MHTRSFKPSRIVVAIAIASGTCAVMSASAQSVSVNANVNATVGVGNLLGISAQLGAGAGLGAAIAPNSAALAARIQAATGRPLSAASRRYLIDRNADAQPGDAGMCRDLDRTFDLHHRSYGNDSPRGRRQLNDCSPTLLPLSGTL